jgi:hypothetical protein
MTITLPVFILLGIALIALGLFIWRDRVRSLRKERQRHSEALRQLDELRQALSVAATTTPAPEPKPPDASLPPLPAGFVRADTCPPGMVEVTMDMGPGNEAMNKAMSAHEGGGGKGVSLADPRKNSASHLGGD